MIAAVVLLILVIRGCDCRRYEPTWDSLDARPLPQWYDQAKVGIFMHLGPYAVPGFESEWFWWHWKNGTEEEQERISEWMRDKYPPGFKYQDFGPEFKLEFFDPGRIAHLVAASGAK